MSICRGLDLIQRQWLADRVGPTHPADVTALLSLMLTQLEANWLASPRLQAGRRPSPENWRLEKRLHLAAHNASLEKTLEKAIAQRADWVNQVPTASGLHGSHSDKLRNIDLVYQTASSRYECVELKVESNTPLYAALETLVYAVLYLHARLRYTSAEQAAKPLLAATSICWKVLAPTRYYLGQHAALVLGGPISEGLESFAHSLEVPCRMDFGYWAFPESFVWPCDQLVLEQALNDTFPMRDDRG